MIFLSEESTAERLMNALITKMETMDSDLQILKDENARLKAQINNPKVILKKAGFVSTSTPLTEGIPFDGFRNEPIDILKNDNNMNIPQTNEAFHAMSWDDIHELADMSKTGEN